MGHRGPKCQTTLKTIESLHFSHSSTDCFFRGFLCPPCQAASLQSSLPFRGRGRHHLLPFFTYPLSFDTLGFHLGAYAQLLLRWKGMNCSYFFTVLDFEPFFIFFFFFSQAGSPTFKMHKSTGIAKAISPRPSSPTLLRDLFMGILSWTFLFSFKMTCSILFDELSLATPLLCCSVFLLLLNLSPDDHVWARTFGSSF